MECIACHSKEIIRYGYYKSFRKYKCKNCGRQFSERSFSFFCRSRFPEEVIKNAILLSMFVSTRNVKFVLKETIQFESSHVSIYNWTKKFARFLSKFSERKTYSNIWHVDEKFVRVKGSKDPFDYLWVVMDDENSIIAVHVSEKRDMESAKYVLRIARQNSDAPPDILVSDGLQAYQQACKKVFGRKTKHAVRHFETKAMMHQGRLYYLSNNRIESLNSKINLWYKKFRGFKSFASANLWCKMWQFFYNLMRPRTIPHQTISIHQIVQ